MLDLGKCVKFKGSENVTIEASVYKIWGQCNRIRAIVLSWFGAFMASLFQIVAVEASHENVLDLGQCVWLMGDSLLKVEASALYGKTVGQFRSLWNILGYSLLDWFQCVEFEGQWVWFQRLYIR